MPRIPFLNHFEGYVKTAKKLAELSMLTAVALIIFIVELQFPDLTPIQGVKLGLANIITVYAVYKYTAKDVFLIVISFAKDAMNIPRIKMIKNVKIAFLVIIWSIILIAKKLSLLL